MEEQITLKQFIKATGNFYYCDSINDKELLIHNNSIKVRCKAKDLRKGGEKKE